MEHPLTCNGTKCRIELSDRALVTTCSHIFCLDCANHSGLTGHPPEHRVCPACRTHLQNPDDAVIANLNPTEDYKTSVLSGLSPNIIMECAGRALSFWAYQVTQEIVYESHQTKVLTHRYSQLSGFLDKTINEANSQITDLQNKMASMAVDQDNLRRKNDELAQAYKEKNRKLLQTQELYDKLKRKAMLGQIQDAATDAVDTTLQTTAAVGSNYAGQEETQDTYDYRLGTPFRDPDYIDRLGPHDLVSSHSRRPAPAIRENLWTRPAVPQDLPSTPSTHRQRPGATGLGLSAVPGIVAGTPACTRPGPQETTPQPQRVTVDNFSGIGLTSRLKASQPPSNAGTFAVPKTRPRVVQRPGGPLSIGKPINNFGTSFGSL